MIFKFISIALIFLGEAIAIYAEVNSSKLMSQTFVWGIFSTSLLLMIIGCVMLLFGYVWGVRVFGSIWVVSVVSVTAILIAEPVINWLVFHELPSRGPLIGFILGIIGFVFALF